MAKKISQLTQATEVKSDDVTVIVQDGETKKLPLNMMVTKQDIEDKKVAGLAKLDEIEATYENDTYTPTITVKNKSSVKVGEGDGVDYSANVVDGHVKSAILKGNTERIPVGKNIFDKTSKLYDGWLYANGNYCEEIGGIFYTTDFIEVKPNTDIVVNNGGGYAQYDDNKKCICNVAYGSTTTLSNTKYIRVVVKKEVIDTLQIEYGTVSTNYEEPIFELQSVKMPGLTTSNEDGTKTNILTVNEDVTLRSNGDICDELNLLTGQLTQRIGEDGVVLSQEVVKTVDLMPSGTHPSTTPYCWKNGHIQLSSSGLLPNLEYSVVTSRAGQINQNATMIVKNDKRIFDLEILLAGGLVNTTYQALTLQNQVETGLSKVSLNSETEPDYLLYHMIMKLIEEKAYKLDDLTEKVSVFYLYEKLSDEQFETIYSALYPFVEDEIVEEPVVEELPEVVEDEVIM